MNTREVIHVIRENTDFRKFICTSERNFGTLVKVSRLFGLNEHCSARSKLIASKFL